MREKQKYDDNIAAEKRRIRGQEIVSVLYQPTQEIVKGWWHLF